MPYIAPKEKRPCEGTIWETMVVYNFFEDLFPGGGGIRKGGGGIRKGTP